MPGVMNFIHDGFIVHAYVQDPLGMFVDPTMPTVGFVEFLLCLHVLIAEQPTPSLLMPLAHANVPDAAAFVQHLVAQHASCINRFDLGDVVSELRGCNPQVAAMQQYNVETVGAFSGLC